jgi:hypothetical protein
MRSHPFASRADSSDYLQATLGQHVPEAPETFVTSSHRGTPIARAIGVLLASCPFGHGARRSSDTHMGLSCQLTDNSKYGRVATIRY